MSQNNLKPANLPPRPDNQLPFPDPPPPSKPLASIMTDTTPGGMLDETNPYAFINYLPDKVKAAVKSVPSSYWSLSERALRKKTKPEPEESRLRYALWTSFDLALEKGSPSISIHDTIRGICSIDYFYRRVLTDEKKVAWIATPPPDYVGMMREIWERATFKMSQVLEMSPYKITETTYVSKDPFKPDKVVKEKSIDMKVIGLQKAIWLESQMRVMGAVVQKHQIHQKTESVNANIGIGPETSMEDIEKQLSTAKDRLDRLTGTLPPDSNHKMITIPAETKSDPVPAQDVIDLSASTVPASLCVDDEVLNELLSEQTKEDEADDE